MTDLHAIRFQPPGPRRAVVVTGASSGIGRACSIALANAGFWVLAGVRNRSDADALRLLTAGSIDPLVMDVTDEAAVHAAAAHTRTLVGPNGIVGLVNCAGVGVTGPIEALPVERLRRQFEINVFGQVTVIQAFLPLLRCSAGRIINIGSVGDRLTIPFGGALTSSKWALASITEALRLELRPWGIHAILIEPGSIHTEAVNKMEYEAEQTIDTFEPIQRERYSGSYRSMTGIALGRERNGSAPEVVGAQVLHALTTPRPRTRYLVGRHARTLALIARWAPDPVLDRLRITLFGLPPRFGELRAQE